MKSIKIMLLGLAILTIAAGFMGTVKDIGSDYLFVAGFFFILPIGVIVTLIGFFTKDK